MKTIKDSDPNNAETLPFSQGCVPDEVGEESTEIGGYRVLGELGAGGMGRVYEAEQVALKRRVALKVLPPHMRFFEEAISQFQREAEAGGRQRHPGIVAVYDSGEADGVHFIAQELVEGGRTLADHLHEVRRRATLPGDYYEDVATLFLRIAEALHHAHESGVIHRDIKPSNILLTPAGTPKVTDFGLAKVEDALALSREGDLAGTPFYMSPEQAASRRIGIDHRTDVFSLGATMYEALTFSRAFDGESAPHVLEQILLADPPDPRKIRSRVPEDLAAICLHALEKKRERRYQDMAELATDLRAYLDDEPVSVRTPGPTRRASRWVRRHPVWSAVGGMTTAALAVVGALLGQLHEQNLALQAEAATAETSLAFLVELFESSDPAETRGADITVKEVLDRGAGRIEEQLQDQPGVQARLHHAVAEVYLSMGQYGEAEPYARTALNTRRELFGDDHPDTLESMRCVANVLDELGRYGEAEALYVEALALHERLLGADHPDTLGTAADLGVLYWADGRYDEAERALEVSLTDHRRVLGDHDSETLTCMHILGLVYKKQARYPEAESLYLEALEGRRRTLGDDHPDTLRSLNSLAILYKNQRLFDQAEPLYLEALEGRRRVLGDDHPQTHTSINNLGAFYSVQGRHEEAERQYREALAGRRRTLGEDHPDTINALTNVASSLRNQGRHEEAEPILIAVVATSRRVLGDGHPATLGALHNLAKVYRGLGRVGEAEPLYLETLSGFRALLGEDHPDTLLTLYSLVQFYEELERLDEAETMARDLVARTPADSRFYARFSESLARIQSRENP